MGRSQLWLAWALLSGMACAASAGIIGTNPPAVPLTSERVSSLPAERRRIWQEYLRRSERQLQADQTFFFTELKKHEVKTPIAPPPATRESRLRLDQPIASYAQPENVRIADILLSFQTPAGGWSKNIDFTLHRRAPGELFALGNTSAYLTKVDNDVPQDMNWNYVGTFDNDGTTTPLRFLSKVVSAAGGTNDSPYRAAFLRGIDYIFAAQYPDGGWPQVWPLQGGYHDAITYNDGAMVTVLQLLRDVADGTNDLGFVPTLTRKRAAECIERGLKCILDTQILVK